MTNFWGPVVAALVTILFGGAVVLIRRLNRLLAVLEDFPPHRHINGNVVYPREYPPAKLERMT